MRLICMSDWMPVTWTISHQFSSSLKYANNLQNTARNHWIETLWKLLSWAKYLVNIIPCEQHHPCHDFSPKSALSQTSLHISSHNQVQSINTSQCTSHITTNLRLLFNWLISYGYQSPQVMHNPHIVLDV